MPEMGQHNIVNVEQPLRLSDADGYRGESFDAEKMSRRMSATQCCSMGGRSRTCT